MSPNWQFCLKIGLTIVLVDFAHLALTRDQPPTSEFRQAVGLLALVVNVMLFSHVGFRTGRETGRATAAAEAGVVASLIPALAAASYPLLLPGWMEPAEVAQPLVNQIVGVIAFNVVLGGLTAWFSGWFASRSRPPAR